MSSLRRHRALAGSRPSVAAFAVLALPLAARASEPSSAESQRVDPQLLESLDRREGGNATDTSGFVVVDGVLWFSDAHALERTYDTIRALNTLAAQGADERAAREAFETSNGFRSLRTELDEYGFRTTARGTRLDELSMPDPTFQELLSSDGEIAVGSSLAVFDADEVHELPADALGARRTMAVVGAGRHQLLAGSSAGSAQLGVCVYNVARVRFGYYDNGQRRLVGRAWVSNFTLFSTHFTSFGVQANNQRRVPFFTGAIWLPEPADSIGALSNLQFATVGCLRPGTPLTLNPSANGQSSASAALTQMGTSPFHYWVNSPFATSFAASDNGSGTSFPIQF